MPVVEVITGMSNLAQFNVKNRRLGSFVLLFTILYLCDLLILCDKFISVRNSVCNHFFNTNFTLAFPSFLIVEYVTYDVIFDGWCKFLARSCVTYTRELSIYRGFSLIGHFCPPVYKNRYTL